MEEASDLSFDRLLLMMMIYIYICICIHTHTHTHTLQQIFNLLVNRHFYKYGQLISDILERQLHEWYKRNGLYKSSL